MNYMRILIAHQVYRDSVRLDLRYFFQVLALQFKGFAEAGDEAGFSGLQLDEVEVRELFQQGQGVTQLYLHLVQDVFSQGAVAIQWLCQHLQGGTFAGKEVARLAFSKEQAGLGVLQQVAGVAG